MSPSSFRSSNVHVDGEDTAQLCVNTEAGSHSLAVCLVPEEDLRTDIVLGFDWFQQFATVSHTWPGEYSSSVDF